jgi:CHAT domain-containing protein
VNEIHKLLDNFSERSVYLGAEATKESFFRGIQNSSIVHVATHSEVSEQDPLFSTVYLNSSGPSMQPLHAYELFDAEIKSDLIMMNSCSSGSGGYLQGSGILGLTRVLRYAGAKSLGLNVWSVNDKSASDFATGFYSAIRSGESKSVSMRKAKLELLYQGNANPYYWGGFMMIGNSEPLAKKPEQAGLSYLLLTIMISAGTIFLMRSRK